MQIKQLKKYYIEIIFKHLWR